MNEGKPRTPKQEIDYASIEGNILIPRTPLGITVLSAERILTQEDPKAAVRELVAPIPEDERLKIRTEKSNAQHTLHGVDYKLTTDAVRRILQGGYTETLNFLSNSLGTSDTVNKLSGYQFDEEGNWATEEMRTRVEDVEKALTPEMIQSLKALLGSIRETLQLSEVKELISKRKELYRGWADKSETAKEKDTQDALRMTNDIIQIVSDAVFRAGEERGDPISKSMADRVMRMLGSYALNF